MIGATQTGTAGFFGGTIGRVAKYQRVLTTTEMLAMYNAGPSTTYAVGAPSNGGPPTVSSCGSGTVATGSTNNDLKITGITSTSSCTVTFHPAITLGVCVANFFDGADPDLIAPGTISTSAVTFNMNSALSGTLYAHCY
jgi:hypothetical protein